MKTVGNFQRKQQWGKVEVFALFFSAVVTFVLFVGIAKSMQLPAEFAHQAPQSVVTQSK